MASLGTLAVNIVARTEKFTAGITKSISTTGLFNKGISKTTKLLGGLVAAAGAYASVSSIKGMVDDLDALGEQSERIGVTGQRLLELRYAAKLTGVEAGLLDKSVGRLNLSIAKAATGAGSGVKSLDELGVSVEELNALSPDQQFARIADALKGVESQSDKARIATALFGKEGRTLLPTLDLGAAGLSKMAAEQRALVGAVSDGEIAQVAKFNDEMDRLNAQLGGMGRELVIDIAPAATEAIASLRDAINWLKGKDTKGRDATNAGQLNFTEQAAQNMREARNKSRIVWETSKDPDVIAQRAAHNNARREKLAYGKAFNDNTVGLASKAIGAGAKGVLGIAGQLRTQAEAIRKTTQGRAAAGLNPLTGLASIEMSDARRDYIAGKGSGQLGMDDKIATAVASRQELTARMAGDIDTYAAARRNLGDNAAKTQIDIARKQLKEQSETRKLLAKRGAPQVFSLSGVV